MSGDFRSLTPVLVVFLLQRKDRRQPSLRALLWGG